MPNLKQPLLDALLAQVAEDLARGAGSQRAVQAGATHEDARPENDKDTRALEATYLARGLAERVAKLEQAQSTLQQLKLRDFGDDDPIALSALVTLEDPNSGKARNYFITPVVGGVQLELAGEQVLTVTPEAPIGRSLIGAQAGDEVRVRTPQGPCEMEIVAVR